MTKTVIGALCASLIVPALIQPAEAATANKAVTIVESMFETFELIEEMYNALDEGEITADEAAEVLQTAVECFKEIKKAIPKLSQSDLKKFNAIMADSEISEALEAVEAEADRMIDDIGEAGYLDSAALKAACEAYFSI